MSDVAAAPAATPTPSAPASKAPASTPSSGGPSAPSSSSAPSTPSTPNSKFADAGAAGTTPPGTPAPTAAEKRKYKLKVDSKEEEWEGTDEDIVREIQKGRAANKRFQESSEKEKRIASALTHLKDNPFDPSVREALGFDLRELVESRLADEYRKTLEAEGLPPEERVKREYEEKLATERKGRETLEKQIAERHQAELDARVAEDTEKEFITALQSEGIEPSYETLYHMAEVASLNLDHGLELTPTQLASEVRERLETQRTGLQKRVIGGLKGDGLLKYLGDDVVREVATALLAAKKAARVAETYTPAPDAKNPPKGDDESYRPERASKSLNEWRKFMKS